MNNYKKSNTGFTLIELMVTVAIVGIFASLALPSFANLIESNRNSTATQELVANLLLAKSEALKRSNSVTLCPSINQTSCSGANDYSQGWIVFMDCNGDNTVNDTIGAVPNCGEDGREELIKVGDGFNSLYVNNGTRNKVTFEFSGRTADGSTFLIGKDAANVQKEVVLSRVGRVRAGDH